MPSNIEQLIELIRKDTSNLRPSIKTDPAVIELYETAFEVVLPDDYKTFLEHSNGLDKIVLTGEAKNLWQEGDYEEARKLGNNILDIESVFDEFEDLDIDHWKIDSNYKGPYPYIPFCISGDNEKLVFGNQKLTKDPSIYIAYHDEPASAWIRVARNFTDFLEYFFNSKGELPTNEAGKTPDASKFQNVSKKYIEKYNSPGEVIKRKTAYINLFPKDALSFILRANAFSEKGEHQKALNDFQVSLDIDPKNAFAYYCRGNMLLNIKKFRQALTDIDTACHLEPDDLYNLTSRAEIFYELNKFEKALADCNKVIKTDDRFLLAYMTRYNVYLHTGEADKADGDNVIINELLAEEE